MTIWDIDRVGEVASARSACCPPSASIPRWTAGLHCPTWMRGHEILWKHDKHHKTELFQEIWSGLRSLDDLKRALSSGVRRASRACDAWESRRKAPYVVQCLVTGATCHAAACDTVWTVGSLRNDTQSEHLRLWKSLKRLWRLHGSSSSGLQHRLSGSAGACVVETRQGGLRRRMGLDSECIVMLYMAMLVLPIQSRCLLDMILHHITQRNIYWKYYSIYIRHSDIVYIYYDTVWICETLWCVSEEGWTWPSPLAKLDSRLALRTAPFGVEAASQL